MNDSEYAVVTDLLLGTIAPLVAGMDLDGMLELITRAEKFLDEAEKPADMSDFPVDPEDPEDRPKPVRLDLKAIPEQRRNLTMVRRVAEAAKRFQNEVIGAGNRAAKGA